MHRMLKVPDHLIFRAPETNPDNTQQSPVTDNTQQIPGKNVDPGALALPTAPYDSNNHQNESMCQNAALCVTKGPCELASFCCYYPCVYCGIFNKPGS